jgi:hypothetical protein
MEEIWDVLPLCYQSCEIKPLCIRRKNTQSYTGKGVQNQLEDLECKHKETAQLFINLRFLLNLEAVVKSRVWLGERNTPLS